MAQQALQDLLKQLEQESLSSRPLTETADRVAELTAAELKKVKQSSDGKKIVDWVKERYARADAGMSAERAQWYKNLDMYQGRQFTEWDQIQKRMIDQPAPNYEPRLAINVIEPVVRTEMAKTGSKRPTAMVSPASNDPEDIMAALAAEDLVEWAYSKTRFQTSIFNPANLFRAVCGNGFLKVWWDPSEEDPAATRAAQMQADADAAETAAASQQQNVTDMFPSSPQAPPVKPVLGKICFGYVDPFHLFVDDLAELDLQKQSWIMEVYTISKTKAKMKYADFVPKDWEPEMTSTMSIFDISHLGIKTGDKQVKDAVMIREMWVKPQVTSLLPKGGLVIMAGSEIVSMTEGLPYEHGEFPYAHITGIETGRFYRKSVVESIQNIQKEINRTYAQIIKAKNMVVNPQFFMDEGSVDVRRWTSRAGTVVPVRLGASRPTAVPMQALPAYVIELQTMLGTVMEDITGQHAVSHGRSGASASANAITALQQTDDDFLNGVFDSIEAAVETVMRQFLSLVVQYWDEPRVVAVTGRDHATDAKLLTGADIEGGTDVRVQAGSALPLNKSARIATVTDWITKKIVSAQDGLEAMEMGNLGTVYDKIMIDQAAATRENMQIRDLDDGLIQQFMDQRNAQQAQAQALAEQNAHATDVMSGLVDPAVGLNGQSVQEPIAPAMAPKPEVAMYPGGQPTPANPGTPPEATQPGAVSPAEPGALTGASVPRQPLPQNEIFFPIHWYDNDQVHMDTHRRWAASQAYELLSDAKKQVAEEHYFAHLARYLNLQDLGRERASSQAAQEAAEMAQEAPTVKMAMRNLGAKDQYAGEQFTP